MKQSRRKQIENEINKMEEIKSNLEEIKSDEEIYFDNMPENLQGSIRGTASEEAIDILEEVIDSIEEAIEQLREII